MEALFILLGKDIGVKRERQKGFKEIERVNHSNIK